MIDISLRMDYADVFNFDKFHDAFKQLITAAKGGERFNMLDYIEEHREFWNDYDLTKGENISLVLFSEVSDLYRLAPDPDDIITFRKFEKKEEDKPQKEQTIRELVKNFLQENAKRPQNLYDILSYVNNNRHNPTNRNSLRASLSAASDVFKDFKDGTWGLHYLPYKEDRNQDNAKTFGAYQYEEENLKTNEDNNLISFVKTDLSSVEYELRYSSKRENKPLEFFTKALSNSTKLDLGLGYFSSASFNVLACGFAHFIRNGGTMRMYINPNITEEDYNLLKTNNYEEFDKYMLNSYDKLLEVFKSRDRLFFQCLSYLIANNRIEIKIVLLKESGIAHEKFGVFTDSTNHEVAFNGSMNLTAFGLTRNLESLDCICSWKSDDSKERIKCYHDDFESIWYMKNPDVLVFPADEFCRRVVEKYPAEDIDELIVLEKEAIAELQRECDIERADDPHFPAKYKDGAFPYQVEAYKSWVEKGKCGVFAMATGTGKTVTSLNCALEEYKDDGYYRLLILVPSLALVEQWEDDVQEFNFKNIIKVSSENIGWKKSILNTINKIKRKCDVSYVIISTYTSFVMKDFQLLFPALSDNSILIADEAHNIGSTSVREAFRKLKIERRIALSATPDRIYDEEGTSEIESFFKDSKPYTYSFSMRKAIDEERLMPYHYFPRVAYLEEDEMQEYAKITKMLVQMFNDTKGHYNNPELADRLKLKRKNIIHKARNKMTVFREIIQEIGKDKLKYCFVYSAAGKRSHNNELEDVHLDEYILQAMQKTLKETFPDVTCNSYTSKDKKEIRKQKLKAFADGKLDVLFAKNCLDEGVDVPRAEYGIFTSSTGNPRQFIQRRGRLLRKHKDKLFAWIYDIIVVPNYKSPLYERNFWKMEKHLVENEMRRVANFGSLASNYYNGALASLDEVVNFYEIDLNGMVLNENN